MVSDAMTLGELYKSKRDELNLSVKEVESATSIRSAYIEAIEEGKGDQLLSAVYMQGFMRQYAIFLGLDIQEIEANFVESFAKEQKDESEKECSYGLGSIEMRPGSVSNSFLKSTNVVWGASFVAVFFAAYLLVKLLGIF